MTAVTAVSAEPEVRSARILGMAVLAAGLLGLFWFKWPGSLDKVRSVAESGVFKPRSFAHDVEAFPALLQPGVATVDYLLIVWPALVFGLVIAASVRAFVPARWFQRAMGEGTVRGQFAAACASAPLMLCSCCVAPIFSSVYASTRRLAPALAVMIGSPSLNLAALALTFLLFAPDVALARLIMALAAVGLVGPLVERLGARLGGASLRGVLPGEVDRDGAALATGAPPAGAAAALRLWLRELLEVSRRTVPWIVLGVLLSAVLLRFVDPASLGSGHGRILAVLLVAAVSLPIALPTFFEIPLALGLSQLGVPDGAVAALLFAGPAINLPSLLTLGRESSVRVAALTAGLVFAVAVLVGLLVP